MDILLRSLLWKSEWLGPKLFFFLEFDSYEFRKRERKYENGEGKWYDEPTVKRVVTRSHYSILLSVAAEVF